MIVLIESDTTHSAAVIGLLHSSSVEICHLAASQLFTSEHLQQASLLILSGSTGEEGLALIHRAWLARPTLPILALVSYEQSAWAGRALSLGACDYLLHPFHPQQLLHYLSYLTEAAQDLIMHSPASRHLLAMARRIAQTEGTVLISGESGTGKERLARFIHACSTRRDAPFIAINCAAIPETMLEAMLFGYVKGAFTGAQAGQIGKFELAQGGTLLLDEIAEMSPALQAKLLRVLQEKEVERLGSHKTIPLDVRIIAATNKKLPELVKKGQFREDLWYRLDVLPLHLPPLRERTEDILPLALHLLDKYRHLANGELCELSPDAISALLMNPWQGNIRELENVIQRALVLRHGKCLHVQDLGLSLPVAGDAVAIPSPVTDSIPASLTQSRKQGEFRLVNDTLAACQGHRGKTAQALGISTRALRYKLAAMKAEGFPVVERKK